MHLYIDAHMVMFVLEEEGYLERQLRQPSGGSLCVSVLSLRDMYTYFSLERQGCDVDRVGDVSYGEGREDSQVSDRHRESGPCV